MIHSFSCVLASGSLLITCASLWAQAPNGIHPRATPADYAASHQTTNATFAASVIPLDEVKRMFVADISKAYVVFEVACFPAQSGHVPLDPNDFLVKAGNSSEFAHPTDPATIAAVIQEKNTLRRQSANTPVAYTQVGIGHETITDPSTGRSIHGTYTDASVGVGTEPSGRPYPPPPDTRSYDRTTLEQQLAAKALPAGSFNAPVAGLLYFPVREIKKKSNGVYELQYLSDSTARVQLQVPAKAQ